jgi:uncharacterized membrane protein YdbT with pleckstrin-like domain
MINEGHDQNLGHRVFLLLALKRMIIGIVMILLVLLLTFFSNYLLVIVAKIAMLAGATTARAGVIASTVLISINLFIFWIGIIICFFGFLIAFLDFINYVFRLDEFDLIIKRGILYKKENSIPYRQIQDVNIERPLIYQILGLSRLILNTTSTDEKGERGENMESKLDPVDRKLAEEIQNALERKTGVQIFENQTKADNDESVKN